MKLLLRMRPGVGPGRVHRPEADVWKMLRAACPAIRCASAQMASDRKRMLGLNLKLGCRTEGMQLMLFTIAIILVVLWALGLVSGTTIGGLVHLLLVLAVIMVLFQLISGRRVG